MQIENSNYCLKFYEPLDLFLKVKNAQATELSALLTEKADINRENYCQSVIEACLPGYPENIKPHIEALINHAEPMILEEMLEDLYQLCLQVNPQLDIHRVSLSGQIQEPVTRTAAEPQAEISVDKVLAQLQAEVIGQDDAIHQIAHSLRRAFVGLNDPHRPLGSFLLVGNTGVGKTQLAKTLCQAMFGDSSYLVRIDCSEYSQAHEASKLIGSPPGYVGHEEGGILTKAVQRLGKAVVLFDEIEKADSKVHQMLLQLIDEGRLSDSQGKTVSFENCLIILTSNLGLKDSLRAKSAPGFARVDHQILSEADSSKLIDKALEEFFAPEFLNRIDHTLHFNNLSEDHCLEISHKFLEATRQRMAEKGYQIDFDASVAKKIVELGFDPRFGAREIKRKILEFVENPLSDKIIDGKILKGQGHKAEVINNQINFKRTA